MYQFSSLASLPAALFVLSLGSSIAQASDGPFVDPNLGGQAGELRLADLQYGRLVDVYSQADPASEPVLVYQDFLVQDDLLPIAGRWRFETSLASGREKLILQAANDPGSRGAFDRLLAAATRDIESAIATDWDASFWSRVPRNAALSARFNDLLNPATLVPGQSVHVTLDELGTESFEARIIVDPNHGGISAIDGSFQPTRILIDLTVSPNEDTGGVAVPLNGLGLPESAPGVAADFALTLPTRKNPAAGLFTVLENLSGASLTSEFAGPVQMGPFGVFEVVRALETLTDQDPNDGFLLDVIPPVLVADYTANISRLQPDPLGTPGLGFTANINPIGLPGGPFLQAGDGIALQSGLFARVIDPGVVGTQLPIITQVRLQFESIEPVSPAVGEFGTVRADASQLIGSGIEIAALDFSGPLIVGGFVAPSASVTLRFSEPMNPKSLRAYENLTVTRVETAPTAYEYVAGELAPTTMLDEVTFFPALPFAHSGNSEDYYVNIQPASSSALAVTDLAGNSLGAAPSPIRFEIDPAAVPVKNGSLALRFESTDEDGVAGQDLRGQAFYDLTERTLRGRQVSRFSAAIDSSSPVFDSMFKVIGGLQTPLSNLGAKSHLLWRYADMVLPVTQKDDTFNNLDVEGLALTPEGGTVVSTFYPLFEIKLGHSRYLPDEELDPMFLTANYPQSGLQNGASFEENFYDDANAAAKVVHERSKGFFLAPSQVFQSETGTPMLRLPLNVSEAAGEGQTYTWRDTAAIERGGLNSNGQTAGAGIPLQREIDALGLSVEAGSEFGRRNSNAKQGIPSVGLPLLMELSCFPSEALSLNFFRAGIAQINSAQPFHRAFSTGGFDTAGNAIIKNPDLEVFPSGGFNGNPGLGQAGAPTQPRDPGVMGGQVDFVTKVSRAHTAYLRAPGFQNPDWKGAILDALGDLPEGTSIAIQFRGHDVAATPAIPLEDAERFDVYGDLAEGDLSDDSADFAGFEVTNPEWTDDLDDLDGVQSIQVRITFTANIATGELPVLDSLVLYWD